MTSAVCESKVETEIDEQADQSSMPAAPARRKCGRPRLSAAEHQRRKSEILTLRQQGLSYKEIAETSKISIGSISPYITELIREGTIKAERGRHKGFATWHNLQHERTQLIIQLCKKRRTLEEIGRALGGLTRERARQLIKKIGETHGAQVFRPTATEEMIWTTQEAAKAISASCALVMRLCRQDEIPHLLRGFSGRQYLLTLAGIEALCLHPSVTGKRSCALATCGKVFTRRQGARRLYCSDECRHQRNKDRWFIAGQCSPSSIDSLRMWHKQLWQQLQEHVIPENDEWITITLAQSRTGLSKAQLWWLAYRKIVTIKSHPTKIGRTGKPVRLYSASEMELARQVITAFRLQKSDTGRLGLDYSSGEAGPVVTSTKTEGC